ncbi:MAG: histidinol dehydrogenase [Candidatus Bathyarchaeota archaeon]|nr:histidinol dehydrogenase [Candidatus Bathyarchaeota archaeon]
MSSQLQIKICKASALPADWHKRTHVTDPKIAEAVNVIITTVAEKGDAALIEYTEKFDKAQLKVESLRVTHQETEAAYRLVSDEQIAAIKLMKTKVSTFENLVLSQCKLQTTSDGITVRNVLKPIESIGCYAPGGQAAYPSTVVMTAVPAKTAGVPRVVVCSPPTAEGTVNPLVLVAADLCGVNEVYKVGGAQAIAALAYGTETIKPVQKIVGPGNRYVTAAKILVSKDVAIDLPAGPSEVLVLADETADPQLVALDMVSQAEHGADSVAGLITTSEQLASEVAVWLGKIAASAERGAIVREALAEQGFIITCGSIAEMVALANVFAPEHVEIVTRRPAEVADRITSAGVILLGAYSPVALSDYGSGTNHVLPTGGFGHAFSGLSALDFVRRVSVVESSREGLLRLRRHVQVLTEAENLPNHYLAVEARFAK